MILFFGSCIKEQEDLIPNAEEEKLFSSFNDDGIKIVDNVVYFEDSEAFKTTMDLLVAKNIKELESWEREIGFSSSYRKVLSGESSDSLAYCTETDSTFKYIIESPAFATIVNEDGVFVIGDTIHKITYDTEYLIPNIDFSALKNIEGKGNLKSVNSSIISYKIGRQRLTPVALKSVEGTDSYIVGTRLLKKNYATDPNVFVNDNGSTLKKISAHLHAWCNNYSSYSSIGVKIVGRKDGFFGWRDDAMWYASVDAETTYFDSYNSSSYTGVIFTKYLHKTGTNVKSVGGDIKHSTGQTYLRCMELISTYTYEDDGSQRGVWLINWQ